MMHKTACLLFLFLINVEGLSAQRKATDASTTSIEQPQFPGGLGKWRQFQEKFFSDSIVSKFPDGSYRIEVLLDIDSSGRVTFVNVENSQPLEVIKAMKALFKASPHWIPATKGGIPLSVRHKTTITLQLCPTSE